MDQNQDSFKIISRSQECHLPYQFCKMLEINPDILKELVVSETHQYSIHSNVCNESLKAFVKYLTDGEVPHIDIHNFNDFSYLSNEFQIPIIKRNMICSPNGILKNLFDQTNGNLGEEINVTSSSIYSRGREPEKGISIDDLSPSFILYFYYCMITPVMVKPS